MALAGMALDNPEVAIPPEVINVLPQDSDAVLELAHRIVLHGHTQKVAVLEAEVQMLRATVSQKNGHISTLDGRLRDALQEVRAVKEKHKLLDEERCRLQADKAALVGTVKRLHREVSDLQAFKSNLLASLQGSEQMRAMGEEAAPGPDSVSVAAACTTSVELEGDRLVSSVLSRREAQQQHEQPPRPPPINVSSNHGATTSNRSSYSAYNPGPGGATPTSVGGGGGNGSAGVHSFTPLWNSASSAGQCSIGLPSAGGSAAAGAAGPDSPHVDGKDFFRAARERLSYEAFSTFIAAIKSLNAGRQGRPETLSQTAQIFGPGNQDLQRAFEVLLNRHLAPAF